jgi:hypothetical protein
MSDNSQAIEPQMVLENNLFPVLRYSVGSAVVMLVAMAADYTLAYLTPVLALTFLAPGSKHPTLKSSAAFILIVGMTSLAGIIFSRIFLEFPLVFIPLLVLLIFHLYYIRSFQSIKLWLIISFLAIPMLSMESNKLGGVVALNLFVNAIMTIMMV